MAGALDADEPRDPGDAEDARDVEVEAQAEDVVRGVDAQELLADPRERIAGDVEREQARRRGSVRWRPSHTSAPASSRFQISSYRKVGWNVAYCA